ncbi:MAG: DUF11 domain-containing protein [Candidatus Hydrogenedentes bacterium]|nr:DUF11 domain-containing protein [Candidatus Hydrogenedentota bacterium]
MYCSKAVFKSWIEGVARSRGTRALALVFAGVFCLYAPPALASDLALAVTDSADPVNAGELIDYTLSLSNSGGAASNVAVTMYAPSDTAYVFQSVLTGSGWTGFMVENGGVFGARFLKASVAEGETASFQVKVRTSAALVTGTVVSGTATVTSNSADPNPANDTGTETTTMSQSADLSVNLTGPAGPFSPGSNIVYAFSLSNFGPSRADNVTVTFPVPFGTTFVSAAQTLGTAWNAVMPAVGGTGNVVFSRAVVPFQDASVFQVVVNTNADAPGSISATATAASSTPEDNPGDESDTVTTGVSGIPCSLAVTRPNGGQTWTIGTKQRIRWTPVGTCCQSVRVELWKDGHKVRNIKRQTPNDGAMPWRIRADRYTPGTGYRVKVRCISGSTIQDTSDGTFTLIAP